MTRDECFEKVREVLVDALALDDDEVESNKTLIGDLGAESIDFLDIQFKLEQAFGFKIAQGEMFPDNLAQNDEFVVQGKLTPKGMATLREKLPHADFSGLGESPDVTRVADIFTVDTLVKFCLNKLESAKA